MAKRKYTYEFKQEAVTLALESGLSKAQVSRDLGIRDSVLHAWISKFRDGVLDHSSPKSQENEEVKRLRKEIVIWTPWCSWRAAAIGTCIVSGQ